MTELETLRDINKRLVEVVVELEAQLARCREALTQIKIICEAPHLDPSQVPSQVYTMETSRSYHAIKAAVVRALAPTTGMADGPR